MSSSNEECTRPGQEPPTTSKRQRRSSTSSKSPRSSSGLSKRRKASNLTIKTEEASPPTSGPPSEACQLCHRVDSKLDLLLGNQDVLAHQFCLLFGSGLPQEGDPEESDTIGGFKLEAIRREIARGKRLKCAYCKKRGATVGCGKVQCKKSYHLPCGIENGSVQLFYDQYMSYCSSHRAHQSKKRKTKSSESKSEQCLLCSRLLTAPVTPSHALLWAPCCDSWLDRECLQKSALARGVVPEIKCPNPGCSDSQTFANEMRQQGIFFPEYGIAYKGSELPHPHSASPTRSEGQIRFLSPSRAHDPFCSAPICLANSSEKSLVSTQVWCTGCREKWTHSICYGLDDYSDVEWFCVPCRRIVRPTRPDRKVVRVWGTASSMNAGLKFKTRDDIREDLLAIFGPDFDNVNCTDKEVRRAIFPPKSRVPRQPQGVATSSKKAIKQEEKPVANPQPKILFPGQKDPMSITLEDLIVQGLNSTSTSTHVNFPKPHISPNSADKDSPADSDYESAHEQQQGQVKKLPRLSSEVTITPTKGVREPSKSTVVIPSSVTVEPIPMALDMSGKERPTFNDKIHQTITDFFHHHKDD